MTINLRGFPPLPQDSEDNLPPIPYRSDYVAPKPAPKAIVDPGPVPDRPQLPTIGEGLKRFSFPQLQVSAPSERQNELEHARMGAEQTLDKIQNHSRLGNVIPITSGEGTGHSVLRGIEHAGRGLLNVGQFAGNAFGNLFAPGLMAMTPGTDLHNAIQRNKAESQLSDIAKEERETQNDITKQGLEQAQTGEAAARGKQATSEAEQAPEKLNAELAEHGLRLEGGRVVPIPEGELSAVQQAQVAAAKNPWMKEAGNQPLSDRVPQLNQALTSRYQVLNPGKPLPAELALPANATKNDFDRIDKLMESQERASASQAQRAESDKFRQAMLALAERRQDTAENKTGSKWVTWTDASGRPVAGPRSEAEKAGATDVADLQGQEIRDVQNARHTFRLLTKQGDPNKPETQGVLQLIDSLDHDGKLGVLASRYNRFATTGVGASPGDDPRIITLLDKGMLADTAAMLAHFGASGGRSPAMLQHFLDLANTGKMDGVTLRAGYKAIADYMQDRGMMPSGANNGTATQEPPRPSNVPEGYKYNANGPKGAGWYKP